MNVLYTAESTAWGGREGRAATSDGVLDVELRIPKEMGGPGGGTNPEQLMATGWAGCFHSALKLVAARDKIDVSDSAITVQVSLGMNDDGSFGLIATIEGELPTLDRDQALQLLETAHSVCPFSNATRGSVEVTLTLTEDE